MIGSVNVPGVSYPEFRKTVDQLEEKKQDKGKAYLKPVETITTLPTPPTEEATYFVSDATDGTFPYPYGLLEIKYGSYTGEYIATYSTTGEDFGKYYNMYRNGQWSGWPELTTKDYVDKMLPLAGGTMTGAIAMGGNKVTGLGTPTDDGDAVPKSYVDSLIPAGYFTGDIDDVDALPANSVSWIGPDTTNNPLGSGYSVLENWCPTPAVRLQRIKTYSSKCTLERIRVNGTWSDWEYDNPPMAYGVEYRTTERWSGKVVYTKAVNCGALPATAGNTRIRYSDEDTIPISVEHGAFIDSASGYIYKGHPYIGIWDAEGNCIVIRTTADLSAMTGWAVVKYVKQ